jgi:hypothetical protein
MTLKNNYPLISFIILCLVVSFGIVLNLGVRRLPDVSQSSVKKEVWIYKDHQVSQTFTPQNDGLNVIHIYLRNVSLRNQNPLTFTVSDLDGTIIRRINLTGYNIGDGDNVRFQFAPIPDSAGKTYTLTLSAAGTSYSKAIGVGFAPGDNYPGGESRVSGEASGDIAFSAFYFPTNRLEVLKSSLAFFIRSLVQPRLIIYLSLLTLTGWFLTSRFFTKIK